MRRVVAASVLAAVVIAGLLVHTQLSDTDATDIAGDALYAVAAWAAVVLVAPRLRPPVVGLIAAGWCVAVELFQLTGLPELWAIGCPPVMLVLGTVFDARDLVVYVVTVTVVTAIDAVVSRRRAASRPG